MDAPEESPPLSLLCSNLPAAKCANGEHMVVQQATLQNVPMYGEPARCLLFVSFLVDEVVCTGEAAEM